MAQEHVRRSLGHSSSRSLPPVAEDDWTPQTPPSADSDLAPLGNTFLVKHTTATGGVIVINGNAIRLTPIQFALLTLLGRQAMDDAEKHEAVRGFVSSYEILGSLPWDTPHPDLGHLKQLIRRLRRRFTTLGIELQSHCGLGYRLLLPRKPDPR